MTYTIRYRDGYLCAVRSDTEFAEPFRYTNWWALVKCSEEEAAPFIGKEGRAGMGGVLDVYMGSGVHKQIPFPPDMKSRWQERDPIPAPKTRVETRWKDGRWEKFLKTKGWVAT